MNILKLLKKFELNRIQFDIAHSIENYNRGVQNNKVGLNFITLKAGN